jgi:hypothetical protein
LTYLRGRCEIANTWNFGPDGESERRLATARRSLIPSASMRWATAFRFPAGVTKRVILLGVPATRPPVFGDATFRAAVKNLADIDTAGDEFGAGRLEVVHDEVMRQCRPGAKVDRGW